MNLLFITQKVDKDDDVLGIYHRWIDELAKRVKQVSVICLYRGRVELPENVKVFSLGKDATPTTGLGRDIIKRWVRRFIYVFRFYRYIWKLRHEHDAAFVHMNPEYVILGGWLWKLWGKKIILWYAHYLANAKLRIAAWFSDQIVTSTRLAYPLPNKKLKVLQQGIDTERFKPLKFKVQSSKFKVLFLGRIAPVKDLETLLRALAILNTNIKLTIVGEPTPGKSDEKEYFERIKNLVSELSLADAVEIKSKVPNYQAPIIYNEHDLFVNLTRTGSFDKSTLEAMACELPVVLCNEAFKEIFPHDLDRMLIFKAGDSADLAQKILTISKLSSEERQKLGERLRALIIEKHNLPALMDKLTPLFRN